MAGADDAPSLLNLVQEARVAAAGQMAALGGTSRACAMGRDGRSFPAYKYFEGQAAAYGDLLRALRRGEPDDAGRAVDDAVEEARRQVTRSATRGPDWESYAAGMLDAAVAASEMLHERH